MMRPPVRPPAQRRVQIILQSLAVVSVALATLSGQSSDRRLTIAPAAASERRLALVVGNNNYAAAPLANSVADATAMARVLEANLGFRVTRSFNEPLEAIEATLDRFVAGVQPGDVALFFYSGHGVEIRGENYLLPVDFRAQEEAQVKHRAVAIAEIDERLAERGARVRMLILDACRDNPFRATRSSARGFAAMQARGALIAFATAPGQTASDNPAGVNGLFTQELLKVMTEPGVTVSEVFRRVRRLVSEASSDRQVPWLSDGLIGDLYLMPGAAANANDSRPVTPSASAEVVFWESIRGSSDATDFEAYLRRFPRGDFADLAVTRRDRLRAVSSPPRAGDKPGPVSSAPSSAGSADPVTPALSFDSEAAVVTILIKPDHAAGFERVLLKLKTALQLGSATRRAQAAGWRVHKGQDRVQGNVIYVMHIDPVIRSQEYDITRLLTEAFPVEVGELYETYKLGFGGRAISLMNRLRIDGLGVEPVRQPSSEVPTPSGTPVLSFESDAVLVTTLIKPDRTADFESVLASLGAAMSRSVYPVRRRQASAWRVYKAPLLTTGEHAGNVAYLMSIDPVVRGAEYDLTRLIGEVFPVEVQEAYQKYKNAFAGRGITRLSLFMDMAR